MRMRRRNFLVGAGALALGAAAAGCTDVIGDEPMTFEASPAQVPDSTTDETGYDLDDLREVVVERTFEVADRSQQVEVTNWQAQYSKTVEFAQVGSQRAAVFTALATPQVEVLGQTFNPVAEMSPEELADRIQDQYDEIQELEPDEQAPITILGEDATRTRFSGEVRLQQGVRVDVHLHVSSAVESGDDFVIAAGGYPQQLQAEEDHVLAMMERIEHDG